MAECRETAIWVPGYRTERGRAYRQGRTQVVCSRQREEQGQGPRFQMCLERTRDKGALAGHPTEGPGSHAKPTEYQIKIEQGLGGSCVLAVTGKTEALARGAS